MSGISVRTGSEGPMAVGRDRTVLCVVCGTTRDEALSVPAGARSPCPTCGATQAQLKITLDPQVVERGTLRFKVRAGPPGRVAPHIEASTGDSLMRSTGRWSKRVTRIDRRGDWYDEVVADAETGEIIHECHEPLSEHRGHDGAGRKAPGRERAARHDGPVRERPGDGQGEPGAWMT